MSEPRGCKTCKHLGFSRAARIQPAAVHAFKYECRVDLNRGWVAPMDRLVEQCEYWEKA